MRVAIMGSGGVGGYVGARLHQAGVDIALIARGAHLQAIQSRGLHVSSPAGDMDLSPIVATASPSDVGPVDIVVFAVKLYDGEQAAQSISPLVGPQTQVITLQNGIDSVETLSRFVPRAQVLGGVTYVSAYLDGPGRVIHAGGPTDLVVAGAGVHAVEAMRAAYNRGGNADMETVHDIDPALWNKFVTLGAFSGSTGLMRSGIGAILADAEARTFLEQLLDEGAAVAAAAGHPMSENFKECVLARYRSLPAETRSSMANDLERGKAIEIDWLSGRMHELGNEFGVATPAHTAVYRALHLHAPGRKA